MKKQNRRKMRKQQSKSRNLQSCLISMDLMAQVWVTQGVVYVVVGWLMH
jgi:hypothetical protein